MQTNRAYTAGASVKSYEGERFLRVTPVTRLTTSRAESTWPGLAAGNRQATPFGRKCGVKRGTSIC